MATALGGKFRARHDRADLRAACEQSHPAPRHRCRPDASIGMDRGRQAFVVANGGGRHTGRTGLYHRSRRGTRPARRHGDPVYVSRSPRPDPTRRSRGPALASTASRAELRLRRNARSRQRRGRLSAMARQSVHRCEYDGRLASSERDALCALFTRHDRRQARVARS